MTATHVRATALVEEFQRRFGRPPEGVWAAPGRVNLIGEHTDYNDGYVLPAAIDREALVAIARRDDDDVRAWSAELGDAPPSCASSAAGAATGGWAAYVAGTAWALRDSGCLTPGFDVAVTSDVPVGAGLSSSAALECAAATALADLAGKPANDGRDRMSLALAAQRAEREVVGAPVGLMDQAISMLGGRDAALFLDCRSLASELVPLPADVALVVVDTRVAHAHATGGYRDRRRECEDAARQLGLAALRDAEVADVDRLSGVLRRRARHVVSENARVLRAVDVLRTGQLDELGQLLVASHASLRDDFEVSVPQLDAAVDAAVDAGAYGARMTGGGFGGSALALVAPSLVDDVRGAVQAAFDRERFRAPNVHVVSTADGARRLEVQ